MKKSISWKIFWSNNYYICQALNCNNLKAFPKCILSLRIALNKALSILHCTCFTRNTDYIYCKIKSLSIYSSGNAVFVRRCFSYFLKIRLLRISRICMGIFMSLCLTYKCTIRIYFCDFLSKLMKPTTLQAKAQVHLKSQRDQGKNGNKRDVHQSITIKTILIELKIQQFIILQNCIFSRVYYFENSIP